MKKTIQLHPAMGPALLRHLRQFGELPARGILAGQAVDSAIADLYGSGGGVYNDLDIFRNAPGTRRRHAERFANVLTSRGTPTLRPNQDYDPEYDSYTTMGLIVELLDSYSIKAVSRQGMLNFVECMMGDGRKGERLTARQVLAGFDLNCTRVAIDLATQELHWDRHYDEFLRSRQLRIVMMHTPWHTFLRLAKKREELPNTYADLEAAAMACTAVANSRALGGLLRNQFVTLKFGSKHAELAAQTKSLWLPYFNLDSKIWYPPAPGDKWSVEPTDKNSTLGVPLWEMTPRAPIPKALQHRCNGAGVGIVHFAQQLIDNSRRRVSTKAVSKLKAVAAQCRTHRSAKLDPIRWHTRVLGTDYVEGQALAPLATKVHTYLQHHARFMPVFTGRTLGEQHALIQRIQEVCQACARELNMSAQTALGYLEVSARFLDFDSSDALREHIVSQRALKERVFPVEPLPLAAMPLISAYAGFTVRELRTAAELEEEGATMQHCVGGYASVVARGQTRILAIRRKGTPITHHCSTVELQLRATASAVWPTPPSAEQTWTVIQNRTVKNRDPSAENQDFVNYIVRYLAVADVLPSKRPQPAAHTALRLHRLARVLERRGEQLEQAIKAATDEMAEVAAHPHYRDWPLTSEERELKQAMRDAESKYRQAHQSRDLVTRRRTLLREFAQAQTPLSTAMREHRQGLFG